MNFDIIEVFTRAAKITWKYKILWIFGMLASCGRGGNGGNSDSSSRGNGDNPFSPQMTNQLESFFIQVSSWFEQNTWVFYVGALLGILLIALQIFLSLVGTAGLARGVVHAENNVETIHFGELFSESLKYFWRLFGAGFIIFLPIFLFIIIFFVILLFSLEGSFANTEVMGGSIALFMIAFCCCLFPVAIFLNLYSTQVTRAITVEDMGVFQAFSRGWNVLTQNVLGLILVGILIFVISFVISIIISLPFFLMVIPFMFTLINGDITSWQPFILAGIFLLCYSPIAWFLGGVLLTYTDSVWTLVYLRVTKRKEENNAPVLSEANA